MKIPGCIIDTDIKRVVVKIGSKILTPTSQGEHIGRISAHIADILSLMEQGVSVVLVSSGAVSHGRVKLQLSQRPRTIPLKQACAGVGQIELLTLYSRLLEKKGVQCGQILLTWDDIADKKRYNNLRNALFTMLDNGILPIINENDSVGVEEITFGDNDTLAAQIATILNADLFVMLTDINGVYTANPQKDPEAQQLQQIEKIDNSLRAMADADGSDVGTGGMVTKINAADMVTRAGIAAVIGNGYDYSLLSLLRMSGVSTFFVPTQKRMSGKKRFLAFTDTPTGTVYVDRGAYTAIATKGKSLLPAGVLSVSDGIQPGDTVDICCEGRSFARGISNYATEDIRKINGKKTEDLARISGEGTYNEVVHRNNLVVL
ncbi:glutamate 5-kinase [Chitinivibrio alkaliphilus]|uniref:Glutamate 5-kinase n=1 Tax=Chitinivibrio alkaliphilus ACht1 TaxID=1313304 RepID=U7D7B6_9BACT|nr:glutamate 5-kinase [Chitinivibrio alkaliphilus]ERP38835.1 glutamate 5-kinase [Chitinivibrio alkaliphilus ACht1]